jgi:lysophospholipid acyltransferase (LPLAT)-like uncharacterized protein
MKIRKPWVDKLIALLAAVLIRCWMATLRCRFVQWDRVRHPTDPRRQRAIYIFWHETLLFPAHLGTRAYALISHHADGELIARVCRHLGIPTVRGSSRRGGTEALMELIEISRVAHLFVTPDGPRGPRRQVQLGLIFLAAHTGLPIIPCGVGYRRAWRFGSWDRFALPWPWTVAVGVAGPAIHVPARLRRVDMERYRELVQTRMLAVTAAAERVAAGDGKAAVGGADLGSYRASA